MYLLLRVRRHLWCEREGTYYLKGMDNVWQLSVSIGLVYQVIEFVQSVKDVGFKVVEPGPLGSLTHTNSYQGIFVEGKNAEKTHLLFDKVYGLVGVHVKVRFLDNGGPWVGFVLRIHPEILSFLGVIFNLEFRTMLL